MSVDIETYRNFRQHLHEVSQQNVYFRRFMRTLPVPTTKETRRVFWLATQREVSEALGRQGPTGGSPGRSRAASRGSILRPWEKQTDLP